MIEEALSHQIDRICELGIWFFMGLVSGWLTGLVLFWRLYAS
jgi:hypothetical protein